MCGFITIFFKSDFFITGLITISIILLLYYGLLSRHYEENKKLLYSYGIFSAVVIGIYIFDKPEIKNISSNIIFALGYVFLLITLYYLIHYRGVAKRLLFDKSEYIVQKKFKYAFIPAVCFIFLYGLFGYIFALMGQDLGLASAIFIYLCISYVFFIPAIWKLFPYKYAFKLLYLLDEKEIFFYEITSLDNTNYDMLFSKYIEPYIKDVYQDEDKIVCFKITPQRKQIDIENNIEEPVDKTLSISIMKIDELLKLLEKNKTSIYQSLCDMKANLIKIDEIYKQNNMFENYMDDINTKYIPYVENLVQIYIDNMSLKEDLVADMQEKIIHSLININTAFEEIFKSMFDMKKIDIESSIEVMNIQLMQDGLVSGFKKGR